MDKIYDLTETLEREEKTSSGFYDLKISDEDKEPLADKRKTMAGNFDCQFIVLCEDQPELMQPSSKSYNIHILGLRMSQWVARACLETPVLIPYNKDEFTVLRAIRPYLRNTEYTMVLYADTPLLTKGTVLSILNYVKGKELNVCALPRGYVFKTDYVRRVDEVYGALTYHFNDKEFMSVTNTALLEEAKEILQNRIFDFYASKGVRFNDRRTTYIDATVSIGAHSTIGAFVSITNESKIGEKCTISDNVNITQNSVVSEGAYIGRGTTLIDAKIGKNTGARNSHIEASIVKSDALIENSKLYHNTFVDEHCLVTNNSHLDNAHLESGARVINSIVCDSLIGKQSIVSKGSRVYGTELQENVTASELVSLLGKTSKPVRVLGGITIPFAMTIYGGVTVRDNEGLKENGTICPKGEQ